MNRHETEAALAKYSTESEFRAAAEAWAREQGFDPKMDAARPTTYDLPAKPAYRLP